MNDPIRFRAERLIDEIGEMFTRERRVARVEAELRAVLEKQREEIEGLRGLITRGCLGWSPEDILEAATIRAAAGKHRLA